MRIKEKPTLILGLICLLLWSSSTFAAVVEKAPDIGDYWFPLSHNTGTYVYANSFVAPEDGTASDLGLWLNGGSPDLVFQIYGSVGDNPANGPDTTAVLATTAVLSGLSFDSLTYHESAVLGGSTPLTGSNTYWFGARTVGLGDSGYFNVGGHTQNSGGIVDNGTFWYSNDPAGINFDGQNNTPEMAFKVTYTPGGPSPVPVPSSCLLLVSGIVGLAGVRKKLS